MCVCGGNGIGVRVTVHIWRSEDSLQESAQFFHHVGPRDRTQAVRHSLASTFPH